MLQGNLQSQLAGKVYHAESGSSINTAPPPVVIYEDRNRVRSTIRSLIKGPCWLTSENEEIHDVVG